MDKNLFDKLVDEERLSAKFKRIRDDVTFLGHKKILSEWAELYHDKDGKFIQEFQMNFHSSFWELYLSNVFNQMDFQMLNGYDRPDFLISHPE